jgi:hypothetical protein
MPWLFPAIQFPRIVGEDPLPPTPSTRTPIDPPVILKPLITVVSVYVAVLGKWSTTSDSLPEMMVVV